MRLVRLLALGRLARQGLSARRCLASSYPAHSSPLASCRRVARARRARGRGLPCRHFQASQFTSTSDGRVQGGALRLWRMDAPLSLKRLDPRSRLCQGIDGPPWRPLFSWPVDGSYCQGESQH